MDFRNISAWSIRNPVPPIVLFLALTIAGLARARLEIDTDDPELDVEDPIGREPEVFDRTGAQISDAVDSIVRLLARS